MKTWLICANVTITSYWQSRHFLTVQTAIQIYDLPRHRLKGTHADRAIYIICSASSALQKETEWIYLTCCSGPLWA